MREYHRSLYPTIVVKLVSCGATTCKVANYENERFGSGTAFSECKACEHVGPIDENSAAPLHGKALLFQAQAQTKKVGE